MMSSENMLAGVRASSWLMRYYAILSGAQSAVAGALFIKRAVDGMVPSSKDIAPYAAFGAIYFASSAAVLALSAEGHRRAAA